MVISEKELSIHFVSARISSHQFLPTPLAHAHNILTVTPGPDERYILENPGAHSDSHPVSNSNSNQGGDGVIETLSLDTDSASANLGKITAYRSGGIAVTTPQSTTDIFYTKDQVDAMIAPLQAQVAVMSLQISALQNASLQVRINGILHPCSRLSFDSGSMSTMYTDSVDHCHVWVTGPPLDPPF